MRCHVEAPMEAYLQVMIDELRIIRKRLGCIMLVVCGPAVLALLLALLAMMVR